MTARRGGPVPHLLRQVPAHIKLSEGEQVARLVAGGMSIRGAARQLGISPSTAWRRRWFLLDWTLPGHYGLPRGPFPPQRGTRACPRGRPILPTLDGADGLTPARTPAIRRVAGAHVCAWSVVWTSGQVARRMGLSRERVRQLSHTDGFPAPVGKVGSARGWAADEIDEWIAEHRPDLVAGPRTSAGAKAYRPI